MPADRPRRPYFIPEDLDFGQLPHGFREAVEHIILPAYQELVVRAPSSLERAAGMTLCYDMWLELLEQFEIGHATRGTLPTRPVLRMSVSSTEPYSGPFLPDSLSLDRYLRLGTRKEKVAKFLLQFRVARARWGTLIDRPRAAPSASPPARQAATASPSAAPSRRPLGSAVAQDASIESGDNLPRRRPR